MDDIRFSPGSVAAPALSWLNVHYHHVFSAIAAFFDACVSGIVAVLSLGSAPVVACSVLSRVARDEAPHTLLVLRSDRSEEADGWRRRIRTVALQHRIPTFDEVPQAIQALQSYRRYEQFLANRRIAAKGGC